MVANGVAPCECTFRKRGRFRVHIPFAVNVALVFKAGAFMKLIYPVPYSSSRQHIAEHLHAVRVLECTSSKAVHPAHSLPDKSFLGKSPSSVVDTTI